MYLHNLMALPFFIFLKISLAFLGLCDSFVTSEECHCFCFLFSFLFFFFSFSFFFFFFFINKIFICRPLCTWKHILEQMPWIPSFLWVFLELQLRYSTQSIKDHKIWTWAYLNDLVCLKVSIYKKRKIFFCLPGYIAETLTDGW